MPQTLRHVSILAEEEERLQNEKNVGLKRRTERANHLSNDLVSPVQQVGSDVTGQRELALDPGFVVWQQNRIRELRSILEESGSNGVTLDFRVSRARHHEIFRSYVFLAVLMLSEVVVLFECGWFIALCQLIILWLSGYLEGVNVFFECIQTSQNYVAYHKAFRRADILEQPIKKKETQEDGNGWLDYGFSCMQGWRRTMEDAHSIVLLEDGGFFGIYDGHSGSTTSKFCGSHMYEFVKNTAVFAQGNITKALFDGFIAVDKHLFQHERGDRSGSTAVVLFVKGDDLYCANAGDSRCVLCRSGEAFPLSVDHKPFLPSEQRRIERAGGYVLNRRVNGQLALSRAIGDFPYKGNKQLPWDQQAVTSAPEVRTTRINRDKDEFAVIACDGIWDVMNSEQVIEFVRPRIQGRIPLSDIATALMEACLSPLPFRLGCDNMSVIIVQFRRRPQASCTSIHQSLSNEIACGKLSFHGPVNGSRDTIRQSPSSDEGSPTAMAVKTVTTTDTKNNEDRRVTTADEVASDQCRVMTPSSEEVSDRSLDSDRRDNDCFRKGVLRFATPYIE